MNALLLLFDVDGTLWDESGWEANNMALKELWAEIETLEKERNFKVTVAYNTGRSLELLQGWAENSELKAKAFAITSQGFYLSAADPALNEKLSQAWAEFKEKHITELPPSSLTDRLIEYQESRLRGKTLPGQNLKELKDWCRKHNFEMVEEDWTSECWETRAVKTEHWVTLIPRVLFREGCRQISKGVAASFLYRFWRHHCLTEDTTNVGVIWAGDGDNDVGMVGLWAGIVPPVHDPSLAKAIAGTESTLRTHFPLDSVKKASALSVLDGLRVWTGKQEDLFNFTEHCGEGMLSEAVQQWWDEKEKKEPAEESMAQEFVASLGPDASMPGLSH